MDSCWKARKRFFHTACSHLVLCINMSPRCVRAIGAYETNRLEKWKVVGRLEEIFSHCLQPSRIMYHHVTTLCACHWRLPSIGYSVMPSHGMVWGGKKWSGWNRTNRTGGYSPVHRFLPQSLETWTMIMLGRLLVSPAMTILWSLFGKICSPSYSLTPPSTVTGYMPCDLK